jgi:hypothetical protein
MKRRTKKNPEVVTAEAAYKAAVLRHDLPDAIRWAKIGCEQFIEEWGHWHKEHQRICRQRIGVVGECYGTDFAGSRGVVEWNTRGMREAFFVKGLGKELMRPGKIHRKVRSVLYRAGLLAKPAGRTPAKKKAPEEIRAAYDKRHPAAHHRYIAQQAARAKVAAERARKRAAWQQYEHEDVPPATYQANLLRAKNQEMVLRVIGAFPGIDPARVKKVAGDLRRLVEDTYREGWYPGEVTRIPGVLSLLLGAGVPATTLAGKFWKAIRPEAKSPADFVRTATLVLPDGNYSYSDHSADPESQAGRMLEQLGEDRHDPNLVEALLSIPGQPSEAQVRQAVNRAKRAREQEQAEAYLTHVPEVAEYLGRHPGVAWYRKPKGWSWLAAEDAERLVRWASKSGACIIDRIIHGTMHDFFGVLAGPKGEVVGISLVDNGKSAACPDLHACCDRHNRHDAAAWVWAHTAQWVPVTAAEREKRRARLRLAKEAREARAWAKRQAVLGSGREDIRAERRGDWMAMATNPRRAGPLRVIVRMPNGATVLWTSQR